MAIDHCTAITKLASQESCQGCINAEIKCFLMAAAPLTAFLLAAAGCLSDTMGWCI
jgi:hypothetical protein